VPRDYFPEEKVAEPRVSLAMRIAGFYSRQFEFIKRMNRHLRFSIYLFLLTTAGGIVLFLLKPSLTMRWIENFRADYLRRMPRLAGAALFFHIAINNLRVCMIDCLMGLIPFYLPAVYGLILNTTLLCLIFVAGLIRHQPVVVRFLTLILPHGIIEIPTMIFVSGFALYLSSQMTKRIFLKKPELITRTARLFEFVGREGLPDRQEALADIIRIFAAVILPLVLIAAMIEAFITPLVHRLFT